MSTCAQLCATGHFAISWELRYQPGAGGSDLVNLNTVGQLGQEMSSCVVSADFIYVSTTLDV